MILSGKYAKASLDYRARRDAYMKRHRAVHEVRPNVVVTPIPEAPAAAVAEAKRGACPKCGREFKSPNVPHFHLRACQGAPA